MVRLRPTVCGIVLVAYTLVGCARPYPGPKTMAAIGTGFLVGGGAMWVTGERRDSGPLISLGFVATVLGAATVIAAGGWMASAIACRADPDCPIGDMCREIPAPPGGIPYKQCVRRE